MPEVLLISANDIKKFTPMNANVDVDKFVQFIKIAQDIHLQQYLGTDLLNKLKSDVEGGTLAGDYLTLVDDYVKPVLIHWAQYEYLPWAVFTINNKGVYKHASENSDTASESELEFMQDKQKQVAEFYTQRLIDYLCAKSNLYPEYFTNTEEDVDPTRRNQIGGWYL